MELKASIKFESVLPFSSVEAFIFETIWLILFFTRSPSAVRDNESHLEKPKSSAKAATFYSMFLVKKVAVLPQVH